MKTLQPINTILLTLVLLVAGIAGSVPQAAACDPGQCEFAMYTEERPSGTIGQSLTKNAWNVRKINKTVIEQGSSISRSGNEITLQPGTYYIHVLAGIFYQAALRSKLRLRGGGQTLAVSHPLWYSAWNHDCELLTYITVPSETKFHIQHYPNPTQVFPARPVYGGHPAYCGEPEVYLTIRIVKVTSDACH